MEKRRRPQNTVPFRFNQHGYPFEGEGTREFRVNMYNPAVMFAWANFFVARPELTFPLTREQLDEFELPLMREFVTGPRYHKYFLAINHPVIREASQKYEIMLYGKPMILTGAEREQFELDYVVDYLRSKDKDSALGA